MADRHQHRRGPPAGGAREGSPWWRGPPTRSRRPLSPAQGGIVAPSLEVTPGGVGVASASPHVPRSARMSRACAAPPWRRLWRLPWRTPRAREGSTAQIHENHEELRH
eukprot:6717458-Pyramimonas_sp.AAC.1